MRLDGRAFHSYLRDADKPFDRDFVADMNILSMRLVEEIAGARLAYVQSDEISILLTDFETTQAEPWFGGGVQKLVSVSASFAGAYFTKLRTFWPGLPTFDCRVWSMSDAVEVANYFVWRQRDAVRNSIQMLGQRYFSQSELHGKNGDQIQEMLFSAHKVNWNDLDVGLKRGRLLVPTDDGWTVVGAPQFQARPGTHLASLIPPLPSLKEEEGEKG
jgi:tRNA(His) 5'-end guanylyltransferase